MKSKRFIQCLLTGLALSGATEFTLDSQESNSPPRLADRQAPTAGGQGLFIAGMGPIGNILTDEQRASFRQAMESQHEKVRDIEIKLRETRKNLLETSLAEHFDEAAVRKQALAVAALEAELSVIRAKAVSQLQPPLSAAQTEKIKDGFATPLRNAPPLPSGGERRHNLTSTNRDENDLPRKQ